MPVIFTSPATAVTKYCDAHVCLSVCVSVRLSVKQDIWSHTRDLYLVFVHVACGCGSVLFRQGDEIPMVKDNFGGFSPH